MMNNETALAAEVEVAPGSVLVVDDEAAIRQGLTAVLRRAGHEVSAAAGVEAALQRLETGEFEAAIVDIRMPGRSGIDLLHEIKELQPQTAVILLTGHGTLQTAMAAIQAGAADYLLKPAQPDVIRRTVNEALKAARRQRQQALLMETLRSGLTALDTLATGSPAVRGNDFKQPGNNLTITNQTFGALNINRPAHRVRLNDQDVPLTPTEYRVLLVLADRPGEVVDYLTLVREALQYDAEPWEAKELIKRHIFAMRRKLEPQIIVNVRGVGYRLAVE